MSFELSWYIPNRIISVRLTGELDIDDVEAMAMDVAEMLEEGHAPIHILLDDVDGGRPPISLNKLKSKVELGTHPSLGWIVAIGEANPVAKFLIPLLMQVVKIKFVRHSTMETAIAFLEQRDISLIR